MSGHHYLERAIEVIGEGIELVDSEEYPLFNNGDLDVGERESLAVAIAEDGVLATDDLAAREIARSNGQPITGSIGLLVFGIEGGRLDVDWADRWLRTWRAERSFHSPVDSIREVLDE